MHIDVSILSLVMHEAIADIRPLWQSSNYPDTDDDTRMTIKAWQRIFGHERALESYIIDANLNTK